MALKIIDVSQHQGVIDWEKAKPYIDGAIIRTGYGDDVKSQDDRQALRNMQECERLGIPYAAYLYSYANSTAQIKSEIAHEQRMTAGRKPLYHFYDLEERRYSGRWEEAAAKWCEAFGKAAGLYTWQEYFTGTLARFDCIRWVCRYGTNSGKPEYNYKPSVSCGLWQYTSRGKVPGISGNVDVSECYIDFTTDTVKPEPAERKYPEKSDSDLAVECMFGIHGNDDVRKEKLEDRFSGAQAEIEAFYQQGKGITNYQIALVAYLERWGCAEIV